MKTASYQEALVICQEACEELVKKRKLGAFCRKHGLDSHNVRVYVRGAGTKNYPKKRYPKIINEFLTALGYKTSFIVEHHYTFFIENDEFLL